MDPDNEIPIERLRAWKPPTLRKLGELTTDEIAKLEGADDPIALLFEMRPELKLRGWTSC